MQRFTLDTNVLWDVVDSKRPRHETAVKLLQNHGKTCEMQVATRFDADVPAGPMRELINSLPIVASQPSLGGGGPVRVGFTRVGSSDVIVGKDMDRIAFALKQLLFPGEWSNEARRRARLSDVDYLIAHLRCGNDYFVTSDSGMLDKKRELAELFLINVVCPNDALTLAVGADQKLHRA